MIIIEEIHIEKEKLYYTDLSYGELYELLENSKFNSPIGESIKDLGYINIYQFMDIRLKIKKLNKNISFSGYFFIYDNKIICIDKDGNYNDSPYGFFDYIFNKCFDLF